MRENRSLACVALTLSVGFVLFSTFGAEGRNPIYTAPTTITASGKYFLSRNITAPPGSGPAIVIGAAAPHVDIDLNGFTVFGDSAGHVGLGVIDAPGARSHVTIRNGQIHHLGPAGDCIRISSAGFPGAMIRKVVIEDVKTLDGDNGILLEEVLNFSLRRNVIGGSGLNGVLATGFALPAATTFTGTIEDHVINSTIGDGIHVEAGHSAVMVRNNRIDGTGGAGVAMIGGEGYILAQNTIQEAGADGIYVEASNNSKIWNNSIVRSGGTGIAVVLAGGALILDNNSSANGGEGIFVDGFTCHVDNNVIVSNGSCGLHFGPASTNNTFGRNTAKGNAAVCVCGAPVPPDLTTCPAGALALPDFCNEGVAAPAVGANDSLCDNMMPGPGRS